MQETNGNVTIYGTLNVSQSLSASVINIQGLNTNLVVKTANYTLTASDYTVVFNGINLTASLPTAVGNNGKIYNIKNISTSSLYVTGSQSIDNQSNMIVTQWNNMSIQSNNIQWYII